VPPEKNATPPRNPTGIVFNGNANAFKVSSASAGPAAAAFIFATENGTISGWSPAVDRNNAILVIDNSASSAVYKGLAVSANGTGARLYATDFSNARVDVFDATFAPVSVPGAFQDPRIPAGFAPFGIQNIGGNIYVSYAKQNAEKHDDVAGPGNGFVDAFDPDGHLIARVIRRGALNSPWGLALAPAGFGRFANRLLVGNFGDGLIHAFDLTDGHFVGTLKAPGGTPLQIGGLWGLAFGNGVDAQPVNTLFFASGPDGEAHGLYGRIDVAPAQE